jgi:hypothetical protein
VIRRVDGKVGGTELGEVAAAVEVEDDAVEVRPPTLWKVTERYREIYAVRCRQGIHGALHAVGASSSTGHACRQNGWIIYLSKTCQLDIAFDVSVWGVRGKSNALCRTGIKPSGKRRCDKASSAEDRGSVQSNTTTTTCDDYKPQTSPTTPRRLY